MDYGKMNDCAIRLPSVDDKWLEFGNHYNKEYVSFIVYADLECVLRKTEPDREDASSYTYQQHEAFSIGYYAIFVQRYIIVISIPSRWSIALYSVICATIPRLGTSCKKYCIHRHAHENIVERTEAYRSATWCHICEKPFASDDTRVRDYYHLPPIDIVIQRIQTVT